MKGSVWQLTSKGICILDRFCSRNGIQQKQVAELIGNSIAQLVILERDPQTDKLVNDRGTIEVIFRRFIGVNGLNVKASVSSADSESLSDYRDGLTGVKIASERKIGGKSYKDTFTGKAATDWLMDCCTDGRPERDLGAGVALYRVRPDGVATAGQGPHSPIPHQHRLPADQERHLPPDGQGPRDRERQPGARPLVGERGRRSRHGGPSRATRTRNG